MALSLGFMKKNKIVDTTTGVIGDAVQGIGIGTVWNVVDKRFAGGKMTATGVGLGFNINAKPVCLNVTDALTYGSVVGLKSPLAKGNLVKGLIALGAKKVFEAFDYIDPPVVQSRLATAPQIMMPTYSYGGVAH